MTSENRPLDLVNEGYLYPESAEAVFTEIEGSNAGSELVSTLVESVEVQHEDETIASAREAVSKVYSAIEPAFTMAPAAPESEVQQEKTEKVTIRKAEHSDIERLAEIDLARFRKAYGINPPTKEEVKDMLTRRLYNSPDLMFVSELDGKVEGFITGFLTNKPMESFTTWEETTNNGTLDGVVDPEGKVMYIVNMTVNPNAAKKTGAEMLEASLMAYALEHGVDYGYFVSRMPQFKQWLKKKQVSDEMLKDEIKLDALAEEYAYSTKVVNGKDVRTDLELRMYESAGFKLVKVVRGGFSDEASLDYGVACRVDVPPEKLLRFLCRSSLVSKATAGFLRFAIKHPALLEKIW
jgi:N-acetylglutamate synthase-like GNAT family acetyltransferase